ncbi:PH domain-containing protein [Falsibacillus pallidus]|uniref:Putative membrane protein n=1 Tax=Falsibacillus pallidus TaxID=493781 RepID=A0A370G7U8_9BACI|nr:PH domain-containing protein [Falsibacillus pallidus]RDI39872.1 putative membrane protein [Falsibacillus pallidus]
MSEYKRLHPIAAVWTVLKQLREMIFPILVFLFLGRGKDSTFWDSFPFFVSVLSIIFILVSGIIKWKRFTYRIEDGELRIEYGLFVKKKRYIPLERIQSLDFSEGILHRPFGLVRVQIETAGGNEKNHAEGELTAIKKEEALWLEKTIQKEKQGTADHPGDQEEIKTEAVVHHVSNSELLLMAVTSGGVGVVLSAIAAFVFQFEEVIPYQKVFNQMNKAVHSSVILVVFAVFFGLLLAWLFSIVVTMLKYSRFTIRKTADDLIITRGLLEKKQLTIPLKRIQAIRIVENIARQPFGFATVYIDSAGGSVKEADSASVMVLPIIKKKKIPMLAEQFFPDYQMEAGLTKLPNRALGSYIVRESVRVLIPAAVVSIVFWPWGSLALIVLAAAALIGVWKYKSAGWNIAGDQLVLCCRAVTKTTIYMKKARIQSLEMTQSWFQKRKNLASLSAAVKSGEMGRKAVVRYADAVQIEKMYEWFLPEEERA